MSRSAIASFSRLRLETETVTSASDPDGIVKRNSNLSYAGAKVGGESIGRNECYGSVKKRRQGSSVQDQA